MTRRCWFPALKRREMSTRLGGRCLGLRRLLALRDAALRVVDELSGRLDQVLGLALQLLGPLGRSLRLGIPLGRFDRFVQRVVKVVVASHIASVFGSPPR